MRFLSTRSKHLPLLSSPDQLSFLFFSPFGSRSGFWLSDDPLDPSSEWTNANANANANFKPFPLTRPLSTSSPPISPLLPAPHPKTPPEKRQNKRKNSPEAHTRKHNPNALTQSLSVLLARAFPRSFSREGQRHRVILCARVHPQPRHQRGPSSLVLRGPGRVRPSLSLSPASFFPSCARILFLASPPTSDAVLPTSPRPSWAIGHGPDPSTTPPAKKKGGSIIVRSFNSLTRSTDRVSPVSFPLPPPPLNRPFFSFPPLPPPSTIRGHNDARSRVLHCSVFD